MVGDTKGEGAKALAVIKAGFEGLKLGLGWERVLAGVASGAWEIWGWK